MRLSRWAQAVFLAAACFIYLLPALPAFLYVDDGNYSFSAWRVLNGEIPYRDFMIIYGPAQVYVVAFFYRWFGLYLMTERIWSCVMVSVLSAVLFLTLRRASSGLGALLGWVFFVLWLGHIGHWEGALPATLCFATLGVYCATGPSKDTLSRRLFAGGCLTALAGLFRQDVGVYLFLTIIVTRLFKRQRCGAFIVGIAAICVPAAIYFFVYAGPQKLWEYLVYYPVCVYGHYSKLNYPVFPLTLPVCWDAIYYFSPLFIVAGFGLTLIRRLRGDAALYSLLGIFNLNGLCRRPDPIHVTASFLCALVISVCLWHQTSVKFEFFRRWQALFIAVLLFIFAAPAVQYHARLIDAAQHGRFHFEFEQARGVKPLPQSQQELERWKNYEKAIQYVRGHTGAQDKIFVSSIRHDRFCFGDPTFYFLSGRASATSYFSPYPGWTTREKIQAKMILELEASRPRVAVLREYLAGCCDEPNDTSLANGSVILDTYLKGHYHEAAVFGGDHILVRN